MHAVKRTILEVLVLGIVGIIVAVTVNSVRASRSSVDLTRYYFDRGLHHALPKPTDQRAATPGETPPVVHRRDSSATGRAKVAAAEPDTETHAEYPYREMSFEEVVAIFNDPATAAGANIFVDARSAEVYAEGHIPGAIQADHYRLEDCLGALLDYAMSAEKIIVYCNGGQCEDSVFLCCDLADFEIPCERLYLYRGGWEEWSKKGMPIAKGRE